MDFTEFVNGFPRSVTTIPDTDPDTDPDKESGVDNPSQHNVKKFPSKSEQNAKKAFDDEKAKEFFNTKFAGLSLAYEDLFNACKEHYDSKSQWVTVAKWKSWIDREKLDNYSKSSSRVTKAPENESDEERSTRQFFTYELMKERDQPGYVSEQLIKYPKAREKFSKYI